MQEKKKGIIKNPPNSRIHLLAQLNPLKLYNDSRSDKLIDYLKEITDVCGRTGNPIAYVMNNNSGAEIYTLAGMFGNIQVVGVSDKQAYPKYSEKDSKPSFMTVDDFEKESLEWSAIISNTDNTGKMNIEETNNLLSKLYPEKGILIAIYETKDKDGVNITFYKNNIKNGKYYTETSLYEKAEKYNSF